MTWILFPIAAQILYTIGNYIDKYLVARYFPGGKTSALLIFSGIAGAFLLPVIWLIEPGVFSVPVRDAALLIASGVIFSLYLFPYFAALLRDDASVVASVFQTIPLFGFMLGFFFLGERLSIQQIIGGLIILCGAVGITIKPGERLRVGKAVIFLMLAASFLIAFGAFLFKFTALGENYWSAAFWQTIGVLLFGVSLFAVPSYARQFGAVLRKASASFLFLNIFNEIVALVAGMLMLYAYLLVPLALVQVINGFQPVLLLGIGLLLTWLFPRHIKERFDRKSLTIKISFIVVMVLGAYLLYL